MKYLAPYYDLGIREYRFLNEAQQSAQWTANDWIGHQAPAEDLEKEDISERWSDDGLRLFVEVRHGGNVYSRIFSIEVLDDIA